MAKASGKADPRSPVVLDENVRFIAEFTIEKHEFLAGARMSDERRKLATEAIEAGVRARIDELQEQRLGLLAELFQLAEDAVAGEVREP